MSTSMADAYQGLANIGNIPDEQRLWDRDKVLVKIARGSLAFQKIMFENFKSNTIIATDPEPKYKSDVDRAILLDVAVDSEAGLATEDKIWIPTKQATYVEVGSTLLVRGLWNGVSAGTLTYETTQGTNAAYQPEMVLVNQRGVDVAGNTWFYVKRGFAPASGGTAGTPANISTSMKFIFIPKSLAEGSNEGAVFGDTPFEEQNYLEFGLEKWGTNVVVQNTVILQDESVMERNGRRTLDQYEKGWEIKMIYGRKYTDLDADGNRRWFTGGLQEYILTANSAIGYSTPNVVNFTGSYGAFSYQTFNNSMSDKFFFGNTQEKMFIVDNVVYTKICNAFDNKIRIPNKELTGKYGIHIEDIIVGSGAVVHIMVHDLLSINGQTNQGFLVDFDFFKYMHLRGLDLQIAQDVEKALNMFKTVNYVFQMSGVKRTNPWAHWYFYNF